jgi:hypothetical protein
MPELPRHIAALTDPRTYDRPLAPQPAVNPALAAEQIASDLAYLRLLRRQAHDHARAAGVARRAGQAFNHYHARLRLGNLRDYTRVTVKSLRYWLAVAE